VFALLLIQLFVFSSRLLLLKMKTGLRISLIHRNSGREKHLKW